MSLEFIILSDSKGCLLSLALSSLICVSGKVMMLNTIIVDTYTIVNMQKIIFIHGANCSPVIWNYLAPKIKGKRDFIRYDTSVPFKENLESLKQDLSRFDNSIIVAHSMGGLYAAHIVNAIGQDHIKAVVTISTPFNGSEKANQMSMFFPEYQMLRDVASNSKPVTHTQDILATVHIPWLQIVSTKGHVPLMSDPNDGVVTINSQEYIKNLKYVELEYNHFEILLNEDTAGVINEFISGLDQPAVV